MSLDTSRIWWDSSAPGAGVAQLYDAIPAANPDNDTGVTGRIRADTWVTCARSGFNVPFSDTVIDVNNGLRVYWRYQDRPAPVSGNIPRRPAAVDTYIRPGDYPSWEP